MNKKTIYLILGLIVVVFIIIAVKGFMILSPKQETLSPISVATTTNNIPDNLSISDEF
jgi:hypothetical protein